jgi:hypothetical protein
MSNAAQPSVAAMPNPTTISGQVLNGRVGGMDVDDWLMTEPRADQAVWSNRPHGWSNDFEKGMIENSLRRRNE